ncbi:hypothetical protein ACFE04_027340 [Oxalis oulophora]
MTTALDDHDDLDRISKLPESTLHHIQSFLTYKNIAQLSVLSKTWKQVSIYQPNLTFDYYNFFRFHSCRIVDDQKMMMTRCPNRTQEKFRQSCVFIDQILRPFREQGLNINKFELNMFILDLDWLSYIDQWIQQAINRNVRELTLMFGWDTSSPQYIYTLPVYILLAKSIVTLKLNRCKLPPVDRYFKTNLSSLKKLFLDDIELSDHLAQDIFTNVEDLTLIFCKGMSSLRISDPVKLKKLDVDNNYDLENVYIDASSLVKVKFMGNQLKEQTDDWLDDEGLNYYPALKNLHLESLGKNNKATISSFSLKSLKINWSRPTIIEINAPNLCDFKYFGHAPDLSLNAPALESCLFEIKRHHPQDQSSRLKEIELLSNPNHCHSNTIRYCHYVKIFKVPKGVRDIRVSPMPNVEKLKITIIHGGREKTLVPIQEEVIESCPPWKNFGRIRIVYLFTYKFKLIENEFVAVAHPAESSDQTEEGLDSDSSSKRTMAMAVDSDDSTLDSTTDKNNTSFCIIEGPETVQDFANMELQEIQDNIRSRRNKIFLLMEEVRRLRIQQRIQSAELGILTDHQEELPNFPSFIPFLPPLTAANLKIYYASCFSLITGIILFGGLLAPALELKLGIGGTSYEDFIRNMHLPMQLSQVDPIVASFSGGAVGVISALMVVEVNNVQQQEHKRCKYCVGTGYLSCARCSSTGSLVLIDPVSAVHGGSKPKSAPKTERCSNCSGSGKVMCPTCLCTGMAMASEHDPRIDPFD